MTTTLTTQEQERYARQIILDDIKLVGQTKLKNAHLTIIGAGALGSVAAELLVRAGITNLTIIDRDIVELSNLQRQALYTQEDIGKNKAQALKEHLMKINNTNTKDTIKIHASHLYAQNIEDIISSATDLILDCTDNIQTRTLIDIFAKKTNKAWIFASAIRSSGLLALITNKNISLNSFMPKNAKGETCSIAGVLGTTTHFVATLQTQLGIDYILGQSQDKENKLFSINCKTFEIRSFKLKEQTKTSPNLMEYPKQDQITRFCQGTFQILPKQKITLNLTKLQSKLAKEYKNTKITPIMLKVNEHRIYPDGRALIKANSTNEAQGIYAKLLQN